MKGWVSITTYTPENQHFETKKVCRFVSDDFPSKHPKCHPQQKKHHHITTSPIHPHLEDETVWQSGTHWRYLWPPWPHQTAFEF